MDGSVDDRRSTNEHASSSSSARSTPSTKIRTVWWVEARHGLAHGSNKMPHRRTTTGQAKKIFFESAKSEPLSDDTVFDSVTAPTNRSHSFIDILCQ